MLQQYANSCGSDNSQLVLQQWIASGNPPQCIQPSMVISKSQSKGKHLSNTVISKWTWSPVKILNVQITKIMKQTYNGTTIIEHWWKRQAMEKFKIQCDLQNPAMVLRKKGNCTELCVQNSKIRIVKNVVQILLQILLITWNEQLWQVKKLPRIPLNGPRKCRCHLSCSLGCPLLVGVRILQLGKAETPAREL